MAQWDKIGSRGKIDDRRGMGPVGGIGVAGIVIILAVAYFGGGEQAVQVAEELSKASQSQQSMNGSVDTGEFAGEDPYEAFAGAVLGSGNDLWREVFRANNGTYVEPTLVLFRQGTQSACGGAHSAIGPHYCPTDQTIYLDETFFDELIRRFGATGGDVAEAYVIAHEIGHHAQQQLGVMAQVQRAQEQSPDQANELSIRQELQADCFAGLWARSIADEGVFERNEITEAIDAAAAVGDDRIQEKIQGRVNPESWTHGSSAQRKEWFLRGYDTGNLNACNTFAS